jgi:hypothetical protein
VDVSLARIMAGLGDGQLSAAAIDLRAYGNRPGFIGRLLPFWRGLKRRVEAFAKICDGKPF